MCKKTKTNHVQNTAALINRAVSGGGVGAPNKKKKIWNKFTREKHFYQSIFFFCLFLSIIRQPIRGGEAGWGWGGKFTVTKVRPVCRHHLISTRVQQPTHRFTSLRRASFGLKFRHSSVLKHVFSNVVSHFIFFYSLLYFNKCRHIYGLSADRTCRYGYRR